MRKLSRTDAQVQARRLQAAPMLAPQSDEGRKEIVDCLLRNCVDVEHASRTLTRILDDCRDPRNLTAELRCAAVDTMHVQQAIPDGCDVCRLDPDPVTHEARWMAHIPGERHGYSCAVRCSCGRGQWLSRRDRERETRQPMEAGEFHTVTRADFQRIAAGDRE